MGRGVSSGGGQSSLGYLFGNGEAPKAAAAKAPANVSAEPVVKEAPKPAAAASNPQPTNVKKVPAGVNSNINNYHRADGQNTGNFITDRPSTKVHNAPGGGSSLGYLFGGPGDSKQ
ncbi:protein SPIRAL1-like 2 [Chenopodium quinoa]|uniref:Protein SPIRAL1-like 1 n=1 Tax=Chenopodium quinoa TaxID=63459 RepID=A0A803L7R6_CHEQI|nr:protein SPIRAL1-like 2 [Chenopodium quinoa]